ncbi:MAG: gamma-glutamyltransferase [Vicinamibacterales bacterium]
MKHFTKPTLVLGALLLFIALPLAQDRGDADGQARMRAHRPSVPGVHGLVTSAHPLASMAGMRVLLDGGNAFDAAVAVAMTLNVVEPTSSGIGGNGFATVFDKKTGKVWSLSMAGAAPKALDASAMTAETLDSGITAGIVPGNLGGYLALLERFGTKSLGEVIAPAIEYARDGHPINESFANGVRGRQKTFAMFPTTAAVFMPGGKVPVNGEIFRLPALAGTLQKLSDAEAAALAGGVSRQAAIQAAFTRFYRGDIAEAFDKFFREQGGYLRKEDLAAYTPRWDEPVHTTYRGYDIYSNPATSRGGIEVLMQLNLVEGFDLKALGAGSPEALHLTAEAIKLAKADVYRYVADPAFTTIPLEGLLSKGYAAERRKLIDRKHAMAYPQPGDPTQFDGSAGEFAAATPRAQGPHFPERYTEDPETTSFSIVDAEGNAVAVTPTLGGFFGTNVVVGDTGVLLNNGLRLGSTSPYPDNVNYVRAGQVPLLNNSPIIVMKDGRFVMAIGTPGGETIGQTEFQGVLNVLDYGLSIQEAIEAPRFRLDPDPNFYKPGAAMTLAIENRVPARTVEALRAMGHTVTLLPDFTAGVGGMQGILVDLTTNTMTAGADPRRAGYAVGW